MTTMMIRPISALVVSRSPRKYGATKRRILSSPIQYFHGKSTTATSLLSSSSNNSINDDGSKISTPTATTAHERQRKYQQLMAASKLSLAPMMDYTDRHFRHLVRLISSRTLLYTEMVAANAVAREWEALQERQQDDGDADADDHYLRRFLAQGTVAPLEGASVLQFGGSDPEQLYQAAHCVSEFMDAGICDYTALNLNCGCPSPKVAGKGCFGAALMEDPHLVAALTQALHEGSGGRMPVTVKCRIGLDSMRQPQHDTPDDEYRRLCRFIETVAANGVVTDFSVHARIAVVTKSFSPADNRKIPQLQYDIVRRLVRDYSSSSNDSGDGLTFTLNGGVDSIAQAQREFEAAPGLNGVMTGRAWAADPWSFACADELLYNDDDTTTTTTTIINSKPRNRLEVLQAFGRHADAEEAKGDPTKIRRFIVKAVTPLFTGEPHAKRYRIALDEIAARPKQLQAQGKSCEQEPPLSELLLNAALEHLSEETLLRTPQESYERVLWEERKRHQSASCGAGEARMVRSPSIDEWQKARKLENDEAVVADEVRTDSSQEEDQAVAG